MIQIVIIDDQNAAIETLKTLLSGITGIEVCGTAKNTRDGIEVILQTQPELVFLDIEMPGGDGFSLIEKLNELHIHPQIIFITAYNEAVKAYDYAAFDYLMKPIDLERLTKAINRLKMTLKKSTQNQRFKFSTRTGSIWIDPDEVLGCIAHGNYTEIFFCNGKSVSVIKQLGQLSNCFGDGFIRCHRSAFINRQYISELNRWKMTLIAACDQQMASFPVSRKALSVLNDLDQLH